MELWIRSQNRETLVKADDISVEQNDIMGYFDRNTEYEWLGRYKTKERALEVLDEIQEKLKDKYIISIKTSLKPKDSEEYVKYYTEKYKKEFIAETPFEEIKPINSSIYVYEMPKE